MRDVIQDVARTVLELNPDLMLFFATGGIPVVIPVMHRLESAGHYPFHTTNGTVQSFLMNCVHSALWLRRRGSMNVKAILLDLLPLSIIGQFKLSEICYQMDVMRGLNTQVRQ